MLRVENEDYIFYNGILELYFLYNKTGSILYGVYELTNIQRQPATTPEPTSIITLIGVGVLGVVSKVKKKK